MLLQVHYPFYIIFVAVIILLIINLLIAFRRIRKNILKRTLTASRLDNKALFISVLSIDAILILCVLYGHLIEPNLVEINSFSYTSKKITGPPAGEAVSPIRIVHLSDLHIESEGERELTVPEMVNKLNPHIIVITGDYLNEGTPDEPLKNFLSKLKAPFGIYAVSGNWDTKHTMAVLKESGVTILDNRKIILNIHGSQISLHGISCPGAWYNPAKMVEELEPEKEGLNILLSHLPDILPDVKEVGFDFLLCGHTHGGQVRIPFYGALVTISRYGKLFEAGWYKSGETMMYVNRGIGLEGIKHAPRVRFLCKPEIMLLEVSGMALP
ncbi:MAG: metallophosphoesterase [Planctomycetes bacterium]|nr:metallophosphoesterase [Planctomycetota bacterium]